MEWRLLGALGEQDRRALLSATTRRRFGRGEVIFHAGDPGDSMHLIAKGHVAIRVSTPLGDVATLAVLAEGDFFGEQALVAAEPRRTATVVAIGGAETLMLTSGQFETLLAEHPLAQRVLVDALAAQVRRLTGQLLDALYVPVEDRVARRLGDMIELFRAEGAEETVIPLKQEDLASLAGSTRPTVNRVLRSLESEGALRIERGRIVVVDPGRFDR